MTVSMRVMSAGDGCRYLLRTVSAGDGNRSMGTPLTRYYAETGTPPGYWLGSGVAALGSGRVAVGLEVSEAQLTLLIGMGRDPTSGETLGRAYPTYEPLSKRIADRVAEIAEDACNQERDKQVARIEAEETAAPHRAVAGFDLTCSVPKSVSVLWAVADAATQERIYLAHRKAIDDVITMLEREVAATRTGVGNDNGAVAQVPVVGVAAAAYDHYDSRAGDPQLHTHVVVSNKVKTILDGRWRSLDGRPIHAAVTALSAHYNAVLADHLTRDLGLAWERRDRGAERNQAWEIVGVSEELIREFSSRTRDIEQAKDRLIAEYNARHGREPNKKTIVKLRAQATLETRPEKEAHSLAELTDRWRTRAGKILETDTTTWSRSIIGHNEIMPLTSDEVPPQAIRAIGHDVVRALAVNRSTWRYWNLYAEASKQTMDLRFATVKDREKLIGLIAAAAADVSVKLTPDEAASTPAEFTRGDGTSIFRPRHSEVYAAATTLRAEAALLARAEDRAGPTIPERHLRAWHTRSRRLSGQQVATLAKVATSGRSLDMLLGPAGAGKTTAMSALKDAWERNQGRNKVVGLAPSAAAAQVLAGDLGIACENTAKWLYEHARGEATFTKNQLIIVDEATLASTTTLDEITAHATAAGAKVLLVGDPAQLGAVEAGGAFALLVERRDDVAELTQIHRFTHPWEASASLGLREGRLEAISAYEHHDRLTDGTIGEMLEAAYDAWRADTKAGRTSLLITDTTAAVQALNTRAHTDRILAGEVDPGRHLTLADGTEASAGDVIVTRRNKRILTDSQGAWVRNGDRWRVTRIGRDGSMTVRRPRGRATAVLPPDYVAEHVDLGYAVTTHRAQGLTVDSAHAILTSTTARENLYVAMTRGTECNKAYVAVAGLEENHAAARTVAEVTARTVLANILRCPGAELSAHQMLEVEHDQWTSIAQLAAEYDTIAAAAQAPRWRHLILTSGLPAGLTHAVLDSDAYGPLTAALRRVESMGHDPEKLLKHAVAQYPLSDADDPAAVLHYRLNRSARLRQTRPPGPSRFIAGLIPAAAGRMAPDHRYALLDRAALIQARAQACAEAAANEPWVRQLGPPPGDPLTLKRWREAVVAVAAYRDRHQVTTPLALGAPPRSEAQRADRDQAGRALSLAATLARQGELCAAERALEHHLEI